MKKITHIRLMIDKGFDSTGEISDMAKWSFSLDEKSLIILGVIAENGPLTSFQILEKGCRKSHKLTRDEIRYRLPRILKDFLMEKEGGKRRNTGRIHKFYHLTFKGLIASLERTSFEKNYIIKKYLEFFMLYADKFHVPEISIQLMKYNLALYLIKNVIEGLKLTDLDKIEERIFKLNTHESKTEPHLRQKPISDKELENIEFEIRTRLHIIQQILDQSMKIVSLEHMSNINKQQDGKNLNPIDNFILNILPGYIKHWFDYIPEIQFGDIEAVKIHLALDDRDLQGIQINIKDANMDARTILDELGIKAQFADSDLPPLFL